MSWRAPGLLGLILLTAGGPVQACLPQAAERYGVPLPLLQAIASVESGHNPRAVHHNSDGTHDIGLMQINSRWLPVLARHGVTERDLWDPCVNAAVAAGILARHFARWGWTVQALGAYHSPQPARQLAYARRVLAHWPQQQVVFHKR